MSMHLVFRIPLLLVALQLPNSLPSFFAMSSSANSKIQGNQSNIKLNERMNENYKARFKTLCSYELKLFGHTYALAANHTCRMRQIQIISCE